MATKKRATTKASKAAATKKRSGAATKASKAATKGRKTASKRKVSATKKGQVASKRKVAAAGKGVAAAKGRQAGASKKVKAAAGQEVLVRLSDDWGSVEELRAAHLGGDLYRLEEAPSLAYSVSAGDTVRARALRGGALVFAGVESKSGNRTLRLLFPHFPIESPQAAPLLEELRRLGCVCDSARELVLRLTLAPEVALDEVVSYLKTLGMWWEHADPTFAELHGTHGDA